MPYIPPLTDSYIDETYVRLVQVSGSSFADGLGTPISFGGATIPGGPNKSLQFNDDFAFSGSNNLTFDKATSQLSLTGSMDLAGYARFNPVITNIDTSISASYIYVSGSTNDLYFSQNGNGYNNVTRLRWLEGNLYTGLLHGGIISASIGGTTYQVASGSGIIVNLNASTNIDPYPIVQFLTWPNLTASIASLSASYDQQFVAINSSAQISAQGIPYNDGDYNTKIPIGIVIHQNHSTINAAQTFPGVGYGWKQRSFDFIKAFGPLKISGYTLRASSSLGLLLDGGVSWVDGRNYTVDPNNPSYITEAVGIATSKIYYYYQSGSEFVYNTNSGAGYANVTASLYSNSGSLTTVPGTGVNRGWTIQRVFYFPNSATKAFYIYYGNAYYTSKADALAAIQTEPFSEAPNTAANAIYVGCMLLRNNADFNTADSYEFRSAGLFRGIGGGSGGSGGGGGTTSPGGSDTQIQYNNNGAFGGVTNLVWNGTTLSATGSFTGSFTGNLQGTSSFATTASYALNGGVTQISVAGSGLSISPSNGIGQVTITSTGGGSGVYGNTATGSYGSFYSTQTQTVTTTNTPHSMSLNNIDISNGVTISGSTSSSIKLQNAGVYDLEFSAQLNKAGSGGGVSNVLIWLRKNDIDLAATNTYVQLQGGTNSKTIAAWNWFLNAAAGDEYRIMWSTDDANAQLYYDAAPTVGPAVPSVIATVARVDQFLSNTGSFTGSFTGNLIGTASWATNFVSASSYVLNASTSSFVTTGSSSTTQGISGSLALTGSLRITGSAIISGSVVVSGSQTSNVANGGTGITIQGSQGSIGLAINTLGGLNGTGQRTHILLGQTSLPTGTSYAIYSSLNMRSYLAGGLETAGILNMTNISSPIRLGAVSDTAADGTYGQFMMSTGPNSRPQWTTVTVPTVPDFATHEEINLGSTSVEIVSPRILEESKYSSHNLYNFQNFS